MLILELMTSSSSTPKVRFGVIIILFFMRITLIIFPVNVGSQQCEAQDTSRNVTLPVSFCCDL
jgi:hypothetical protein